MQKVSDGLYLMYVKDEEMYPVIMAKDEWEILQSIANAIASPVRVSEKSLGKAYYYKTPSKPKENPLKSVKTADITKICK